MVAAERARPSSANCFDGDEHCLKIKDSVNFASGSIIRKKKRESKARSSVRY